MPLQATSGAASYDAFGGGAAAAPQYIEDVFSTWLYTGTGAAQTITNGIDLAGKGGLVWLKSRNYTQSHGLFDTARGENPYLCTDLTNGQFNSGNGVVYNSNGFTNKENSFFGGASDGSGFNYGSWTFQKQPKFFDVVTWTGSGANRTIAHSLGSVPGCIIVKRTDTAAAWQVYHRSLANTQYMVLNTTAAAATGATRWNSTTPTNTVFSLGTDASVNASGGTYVAYIYAHNAGGFGLTGTDSVISCGSYTGTGSGAPPSINLGWEPQYILIKAVSAAGYPWEVFDNMRGLAVSGNNPVLLINTTDAEYVNEPRMHVNATGFYPDNTASQFENASGVTYIYIAIRRGPMKVPTTGTSVLGLNARSGTGANATVTGGAGVTDLAIIKNRGSATNWVWTPRLAGTGYLSSNATTAETAAGTTILQANPWDVMDGVKVGTTSNLTNASGNTFANYLLDRAPGFMDVVCYTGTGSARTVAHNLGVAPELMIVKNRTTARSYAIYASALSANNFLTFSTPMSTVNAAMFNGIDPTSSVFSVGTSVTTNESSSSLVAYLFATCPGVSKVGSYTGTGATQTINCGFTGGARFVLIKATSTTGDWYVWDSARGIVPANDPYLLLNSTAAEVTNTDWVDTAASGFELSNAGGNLANSNGVSYIFLAIA